VSLANTAAAEPLLSAVVAALRDLAGRHHHAVTPQTVKLQLTVAVVLNDVISALIVTVAAAIAVLVKLADSCILL
jgi:hypothetical protein